MTEALIHFLQGRTTAVLTGAGISTESGIPDYRGPETRRRAREPMRFAAFMGSPEARARYWARSTVGWERFRLARPNAGHDALVRLERAGFTSTVITQNVDRLHHAAGSQQVVELHGALAEVRCLDCDAREDRDALQARIRALNPAFDPQVEAWAPDGDADVAWVADFVSPVCVRCAGTLKPDVVFFGENVPRERVDEAYARIDRADALLVVGSSLAVFSGFRFVRHAHTHGKPVAILNLGESRGDPYAMLRIEQPAGEVLSNVARALLSR